MFDHIVRLVGFHLFHCRSDFSSFTLSPLCSSCSVLPIGYMAWVDGEGLVWVGLIGMLGCGDSRGQGLVVGWAGGSCCNGGWWLVRLCAGWSSFSWCIVVLVCIVRTVLRWWRSLLILFRFCGEACWDYTLQRKSWPARWPCWRKKFPHRYSLTASLCTCSSLLPTN